MSIFHCTNCDAQTSKWAGRCGECGKWGTIEADATANLPATPKAKRAKALADVAAATPVRFAQVSTAATDRISSGLPECDRVLGGGLVPGALLLLGGDPGIGKSTLIAQIAARLPGEVLYVSGEETAQQVKLRFDRLGLSNEQLQFLAADHVEVIAKTIETIRSACVMIDSIQTMASGSVEGEPGSVNQIKAATVRFLEIAKATNVPVILIGHVTKGGELGGPKTLEHMVDVVLYLEGDRGQQFRLLRSVKNRFGATDEIGVFQMTRTGLQEVVNPSAVFVAERSHVPGAVITAAAEGQRIFLLEIQALVNTTVFGYPQRKVSGFDLNRLNVLLAVLEQRAGLSFGSVDVYINVVGGGAFKEPALDAAVCVALASALKKVAISEQIIVWGEVGLGGELRSVSASSLRLKEAKRFGATTVIAPPQVKTLQQALQLVGVVSK
jgi:DNA repair protein RadA/Sms